MKFKLINFPNFQIFHYDEFSDRGKDKMSVGQTVCGHDQLCRQKVQPNLSAGQNVCGTECLTKRARQNV